MFLATFFSFLFFALQCNITDISGTIFHLRVSLLAVGWTFLNFTARVVTVPNRLSLSLHPP